MTVDAPARWETTDRLDVFTDILRQHYLPFVVSEADAGAEVFSAVVREQPLGELRVLNGVTAPHGGRRTRRQVSATPRDIVALQYVAAGREVVRQDDRVLVLGPGDTMVFDSEFTGTYEILETLHKHTLVVPGELAVSLLPVVHRPGIVQMISDQQAGVVRSLFGMVSVLSDVLATMSEQAVQRSAALIVQLLADLDPFLQGDRSGVGRRETCDLRERVMGYVEANLCDAALSPATIAATHFVSTRTLYAAFEGWETTLAAHIRARRLARCHADLMTTDDRVGDIAARWGFVNLTHFSRIFAKRYGVPPSRVRPRAHQSARSDDPSCTDRQGQRENWS